MLLSFLFKSPTTLFWPLRLQPIFKLNWLEITPKSNNNNNNLALWIWIKQVILSCTPHNGMNVYTCGNLVLSFVKSFDAYGLNEAFIS